MLQGVRRISTSFYKKSIPIKAFQVTVINCVVNHLQDAERARLGRLGPHLRRFAIEGISRCVQSDRIEKNINNDFNV